MTALNQTITATDEIGSNAERLHGLIVINAPIEAGDSGGPLYDSRRQDHRHEHRGVAEWHERIRHEHLVGLRDPDRQRALDRRQDRGRGRVHRRSTSACPASWASASARHATGGVAITSVLPDGPAAKAGITAGSVITSVNGKSLSSATALKTALSSHKAGARVTINWTDTAGSSHSATVTLVAGPAD